MARPLGDRWRDLLFDVRVSQRYHERRWQFFLSCNRIVSFVAVFFSTTGAVALYFLEQPWAWVPVVVVAVVGLADLIYDSARKATEHAVMKREFVLLERRMTLAESSEDALKEMVAARLEIEADEPPIKRILIKMAYNDVLRSMGYPPDKKLRLRWIQRVLAQFVDIGTDSWSLPPQTPA